MKNVLEHYAVKLNKFRKFREHWHRIAQVMAVIVVFCTTYALILPAITMTEAPICGQEAHVHTDACYRQPQAVLSGCGLAEDAVIVHLHGEICWNQDGELICPLEEIAVHVHDSSCYTQESVLSCIVTHVHSDACTVTERELTCELPESKGHAHGEGCGSTQSVQICTETIHEHGEGCFEEQTVPCEIPETEGHTHDDSCYAVTVISCTEPTAEDHEHEDACWQQTNILTCSVQELQLHSHEESCYDEQSNLICTQPLVVEHIHTEACLTVPENTEPELVCTLQEHTHVEECYPAAEENQQFADFHCGMSAHTHLETCYHNDGSLGCTIPEHSHTVICAVNDLDMSADLETEEDWKKSVSDAVLTGNWPGDLLAVAQTQLDYRESRKNVILLENSLKGYTRYGEWYGSPYSDWNTLFAAFCLEYAGVEDFPVDADANRWVEELTKQEFFKTPDVYSPKPGDLIFLDRDRISVPEGELSESENIPEQIPAAADEVGIVAELLPETADAPAQIKLIAGDCGGQVRYAFYDWKDPMILGYARLPDAKDGTYICDLMNHKHSWACIGGKENCLEQEHTHTKACVIQTLSFENEAMQVVMTLNGYEGMPEDLALLVVPITSGEGDAYDAMVSAVGQTMLDSAYYVNEAVFYQISLLSDGSVYELPEDVRADVQVTMLQSAFAPESIEASAGMRTFTLAEETAEAVEESSEEVAEEEPAAETEGIIPMLMRAVAPVSEEPVASTFAWEPEAVTYQATEISADGEGNQQISFAYGDTTTFGVALTDVATVTGLWKRVSSLNDLNADSNYLIVSVEGNYALNTSAKGTKVYIDSIKANEDYYTITGTDGKNISANTVMWSFSKNGNEYTVKNPYTNYFIQLDGRNILSTGTGDSLVVTYMPYEGAWTFQDNRYLLNSGSSSFTQGNPGSADYHTRSMLIFQSVSDALQVPDDVVSKPNTEGESGTATAPTYKDYLPVTGGLSGQSDYVTADGESMKLSYYSDPATSQLESHFSIKTHQTVAAQWENNGMVHSDKSVIYGDDDYGAFASYDDNLFGVTLSALGQEFATSGKEQIHIPVDVMFILDISGSMNSNKVPNSNDTRSKAMVNAVNQTIAEIMERDPNNRVGAVLFSTGTGNLLEMGRYTADNNQFLKMENGSWTATGGSGYSFSGPFIYRGDTLRKDGVLYNSKTDVYATQFNGTYTQAGIALGAEKLMNVEDTTCSIKAFVGSPNETTIKVRRQPVIILLSDGEPTHSTSNYKDVLSGPHYGDGLANDTQYRGVHGYYTILSANYYKRMVGIHYNQPAQFYTVGMGIDATGSKPADTSDDGYYKRAVLDPTPARIKEAYDKSTKNRDNTSRQLSNLLSNSYNGDYIKVTNGSQGYMPEWIGQVHDMVPVLDNPYVNDYSYADAAFFGNYNAAQLAQTFGDILNLTEAVSEYGFILRSRTALRMEDPIGEGMEVKGAPVLRFGGNNYPATGVSTSQDGKTVTYVYDHFYQSNDGSGFTADLSNVSVKVVTDDAGLQTVYLNIPDYVLPAYMPYMLGLGENAVPQFYYEQLPIRLIYQVGLTEAAQKEIDEVYLYGGEKVFYTNRYQNNVIATTDLLPTDDNPFYMEHASHGNQHENCHHIDKSSNLTGTVSTSFECHHALVSHVENGTAVTVPEVTQKLGNNGKLEVRESRKVIDIPVEKIWRTAIDLSDMGSVQFELYRVTADTATLVDSLELSAQTQWKGKFQCVPILTDGSFYAVRENAPDGFMPTYNGEVIMLNLGGRSVAAVKVQNNNSENVPAVVIYNDRAYELPQTGGIGTHMITFSGLFLITVSLMYIKILKRKQKKGVKAV